MRNKLAILTVAVMVFSSVAGVSGAAAGPFGNALGGAGLGALIGGIAGGGKGAAIGAAVGGGLGAIRAGQREKEQRMAAEKRNQEERAQWEQQRKRQEQALREERQKSQQQKPSADDLLVSETQRSLIRLGYDPGPVGTINPQTESAVRAYQRDKGLLETGQLSQALLKHMIQHGG